MAHYTMGMGCDRGVSIETLEAAVTQAFSQLSIRPEEVKKIATIDKKSDEVALLQLAKNHQWTMEFYTAAQLCVVEVPNPSAVVMKYMGTPTVAEAAALLAGAVTQECFVLEKLKFLGEDQKNATVSIVKVEDE